jgi:hypothetical protein
MTQPTPIELVEKLRVAQTIPEMARIVAALLNSCGIRAYQQIGYELSRLAVTGLGRE